MVGRFERDDGSVGADALLVPPDRHVGGGVFRERQQLRSVHHGRRIREV
jgi:hypothetical protein